MGEDGEGSLEPRRWREIASQEVKENKEGAS